MIKHSKHSNDALTAAEPSEPMRHSRRQLRKIFGFFFVSLCLFPAVTRIPLYPFLTYDMFVNEQLLPNYYVPIAHMGDGTEQLIASNNVLYPYRLVSHDFVSWYDLQYRVRQLLQQNDVASLKSDLRTWCRRTPHCISATLFQYDELFKNGIIDLHSNRTTIASWSKKETDAK